VKKQVGTFSVVDAFCITGRGWVLTGTIQGDVTVDSQLAFDNGVSLQVRGMEMMSRTDKQALLISATFASRQELIDQHIIGATAQILE
jgi:hypothetical protein